MQQRVLEPEIMLEAAEVAAYDELARKYLHVLHRGFVETVINHSPLTGRFLEVGTGTGWISVDIAAHLPDVRIVAGDLSWNMLGVARENAAEKGVLKAISFELCDAKRLPYQDNSFDSVYCHNMLHHLPDPMPMLKEINRVAKQDGAILIRDLMRIPHKFIPFHVHGFGLPYSTLMKEEYENSIRAALSPEEWQHLADNSGILSLKVTRQFVTHQTMFRSARNRRQEYLEVRVPLIFRPFKRLYVIPPG